MSSLRAIAAGVPVRYLRYLEYIPTADGRIALKVNNTTLVGIFNTVQDAEEVAKGLLTRFGCNNPDARLPQVPTKTSMSSMFTNAISGQDTLDVVVVGDSNAGFNNYGYSRSFGTSLIGAGAEAFASPLVSSAHQTAGGNPTGRSYGFEIYTGRLSGQSGGLAWLVDGTLQGYPDIDQQWNYSSGQLRVGSTAVTWAFCTGQTAGTTFYIDTTPQVGATPAAAATWDITQLQAYRVGFAKFASTAAVAQIRASQGTTLIVDAPFSCQSDDGTNKLVTESIVIPADPLRRGEINFTKYGAGITTNYTNLGSPAGFAYESVHAYKNGFAVDLMQYYPAATTSTFCSSFTTNKGTVKTYLKELYNRQLAAGGNGNVVFWMNGGVNGGPAAPSDWSTGATSLYNGAKLAWKELGFPPERLKFLFSVTHPQAAVDNLAATRAEAVAWCIGKEDVQYIETADIVPNSLLTANSWYDAGGNAHMTTAGYDYVTSEVISLITG